MANLKPGDRVDCRLKNAIIVSPYKEYDEVLTFEIVATDKYGYYLYVPSYYFVKGTFKADTYQCKNLVIEKRFLDTEIVYIQENLIDKVSAILDGLRCKKCQDFFVMATPNQEDGTLICWSCRNNPYR